MEARVIYNSLFQYRQLAEVILDASRGATPKMALRALKIAKFLRYYAWICQSKKLFFLVETIGQDLRVLCEVASKNFQPGIVKREAALLREIHDKLLDVFLSLGEFATLGSKRGVIRAHVILAVYYCHIVQVGFARKIRSNLDKDENRDLLLSIKEELQLPSTKEFWEVSERGSNFTYLEPHLRDQIPKFYEWFTWHNMTDEVRNQFLQSKEGIDLKVQQELMNFETNIADGKSPDDEVEAEQDEEFARKIRSNLDKDENRDLLLSIKEELQLPSTKEFWEVSERGSNFTYLEPHLRDQIPKFYEWFTWHNMTDEVRNQFLQSKEGIDLKVQQELMNFETNIADGKSPDDEVEAEQDEELARQELEGEDDIDADDDADDA
eukprot:TRINITY_DN5747_c0_g1_i1.p1 TRINITY_DN5747_c0_g1~~TRINITY_DN5747_c0_g1_i1.p1  ORF type:complete len:380 (+),score=143.48 TRINITY_DN5747_c0_g1_i1:950-2089(+)